MKHEQRLREWEESLRQEAAEIQSKFADTVSFDESIPPSPSNRAPSIPPSFQNSPAHHHGQSKSEQPLEEQRKERLGYVLDQKLKDV